MSKFCFNCGNPMDDSAIFCPGCGSKQLPPADINQNPAATSPFDATVIADSEPASFSLDETMVAPAVNSEPVFAPVQPPFSPVQPPEQQYYQPPVAPPEPPKKNKTAVTVAVCAVILCVTLIATFAVLAITGTISFGKDKKDDKETTESIRRKKLSFQTGLS